MHSDLGVVKFQLHELGGDPDGQVAKTIAVMQDRAGEDSEDPGFRHRALLLIGPGSEWDQVCAIHQHARRAIKFQRDEVTGAGVAGVDLGGEQLVEVIVRPADMANYIDQGIAEGDCDDFSMYCAALMRCLGIDCKFATLAADGRAPDQYSHVYVVAYPRDRAGNKVRLVCDASHGEYPGWEGPNRFGKLREWPTTSQRAVGLLSGLAAMAAGWWIWKSWRTGAA